MTDLLTPDLASPIAGVPAVQLTRWAYLRVGPPNRGTQIKPLYDEGDLRTWREGWERIKSGEVVL